MPSEMQAAISQRAASGCTIGNRQNKIKHDKQPKKSLQLFAEDVSIPDGIFCDAQRQLVKQTAFASIAPDAHGIVVASADKALPYIRIQKPLSKHALAMIIVDYLDPIIQDFGEQIRFPARCERTGEPILLTARIIQLVSSNVIRNALNPRLRLMRFATRCFAQSLSGMKWKAPLGRHST